MNKSSIKRTLLIASILTTFGSVTVKATTPDACCGTPMTDKAGTTTPAPAATYPLTTCVVSGDALEGGDMGGPVDYIHKEAGKPDRLVRFCCSGCIKKFKKDPSKYLAKLDAANNGAGKSDPGAISKPTESHTSHAY